MVWRYYVEQCLTILIRRSSLHGSVLKNLYTKIIHTTCSVHALHRLAEEIRGQFNSVDELLSNMKKFFRKSPYRVALFKSIALGIRLPPEPI